MPSLCQTPELSLHPEQLLRMGLGLVLSDLPVTVALQGLELPACRLHLLLQVWWSLTSMCQSSALISSPAPHLCCSSWSAACFLLAGDFGGLSACSSSPLGTHTLLSLS